MRRTLPVLFVLLLAAVVAFAAVDVNGTWKASMDSPGGGPGGDISLKLKAEGTTLTGSVTAMGTETKIENGKLDGDKISFETNPEMGKIVHKGTVSGDEMKLTVTVMGQDMPMTFKRVK